MQRYMMQGFPSGTSNYVKKLIDDLLSAVGIDQPDVIPTLRSRILAAGKAQGLEARSSSRGPVRRFCVSVA